MKCDNLCHMGWHGSSVAVLARHRNLWWMGNDFGGSGRMEERMNWTALIAIAFAMFISVIGGCGVVKIVEEAALERRHQIESINR